MRAEDLTRAQAAAVKNKLRPMLGYLGRLKRRMVQRGFLSEDPMLAAVVRAEDAVHALHIQLHYLSCGEVVGRSSPKSEECDRARKHPHTD
jgi:hypothetical protein